MLPNECAGKHSFINGNSNNNIKNEEFGFKTKNSPTPCDDLQKFEKELFDFAKFIRYKKRTDVFKPN